MEGLILPRTSELRFCALLVIVGCVCGMQRCRKLLPSRVHSVVLRPAEKSPILRNCENGKGLKFFRTASIDAAGRCATRLCAMCLLCLRWLCYRWGFRFWGNICTQHSKPVGKERQRQSRAGRTKEHRNPLFHNLHKDI